ncbi:acyltransferase family protein [Lysinibacillus xylanilyticus]|uniref:acyltransferase family protein n=1 Tax=Lysinibacillus xylanilyticus TaxID=582475 RepID=UPI003CFD4B3A
MREYYPNFDWLRLILAIQVVGIHTGVSPTVLINPVPAFLAISGFVVLGSIERRTTGHFFKNRALRVLPLLFVSFLAVGFLFGKQEMFHNIKFWIWPFGEPPINAVVWSLIYEEFFYFILAILFALSFYKYKFFPILMGTIFITLTITNNFFGLPSPLFMLAGAFMIGNVAYMYRSTIKKLNKWVALGIFVLMVFTVHTIPYNNIVEPSRALIDFISFGIMLIFAIAGPELPKLKIDISYSLYLWHCIIRAVVLGYIPIGPRMFWVVLLCTLPICYFSWHLIELPAKKLSKGFPSKQEILDKVTSRRFINSFYEENSKKAKS